jgi:hypothetical protein
MIETLPTPIPEYGVIGYTIYKAPMVSPTGAHTPKMRYCDDIVE